MREVDRLADLGVALFDDLAALGSHDLEQVAATPLQLVTGAVQDLDALGERARAPLVGGSEGAGDRLVERLGGRERRLLDRRVAEVRLLHACADVGGPVAVRIDRRIRVGGVAELAAGPVGLWLAAIHDAVRLRHLCRHHLDRGEEALPLTLEQPLVAVDVEHRRHEVVRARALLETANQVGDRDIELAGMHDRRVEQQLADVATDDGRLLGRHAEQHLELDAGSGGDLDAAPLGEQLCERDVEEVVARDADVHVCDALGGERVVEHLLVAGVGVLLRLPGRERPAVRLGLDLLHRQVRALDDAHLHRGSAVCDARRRPFLQPDHRGEAVGQVRLQYDAGARALEFVAVEDLLEHVERDVEILVLLHVEVDERVVGDRGAEHRRERLDGLGDSLVVGPEAVRHDGRRDLNRDVLDVVALDEADRVGDALVGLALAEDRLAEQVDVESRALAADLLERRAEALLARVDDEVAHHLAQHLARDRHDERREHRGDGSAQAHETAQGCRQEAGDVARDALEVARSDVEILRLHHTVNETDGEVEALGVAQHAREVLRCGIDLLRSRLDQPRAHLRDRLVGERPVEPRIHVWGRELRRSTLFDGHEGHLFSDGDSIVRPNNRQVKRKVSKESIRKTRTFLFRARRRCPALILSLTPHAIYPHLPNGSVRFRRRVASRGLSRRASASVAMRPSRRRQVIFLGTGRRVTSDP